MRYLYSASECNVMPVQRQKEKEVEKEGFVVCLHSAAALTLSVDLRADH